MNKFLIVVFISALLSGCSLERSDVAQGAISGLWSAWVLTLLFFKTIRERNGELVTIWLGIVIALLVGQILPLLVPAGRIVYCGRGFQSLDSYLVENIFMILVIGLVCGICFSPIAYLIAAETSSNVQSKKRAIIWALLWTTFVYLVVMALFMIPIQR